MKEFSEYEKKILKALIDIDDTPGGLTVLGNFIDSELYPNFYIKLISETECPVYISKRYADQIESIYGNTGLTEVIKQLNNKLLFISKLFQYLEREGQIYFGGENNLSFLGSPFDKSEVSLKYELEDKDTIKSIYNLARRRTVINESLKKFVKNGFKTDQEVKQEREQRNISRKINWTALGVIGGLLLGVPDFIDFFKEKEPTQIKFVSDSLRFKVTLDTLNVRIIDFEDTLDLNLKQPNDKSTNLKVEIIKPDTLKKKN